MTVTDYGATVEPAGSQKTSSGAGMGSLVAVLFVGIITFTIGAVCWGRPPPHADGWRGPVDCIVVHRFVVEALDGTSCEARKPRLFAARRLNHTCSTCKATVACGADSLLPNLIDGQMQYTVEHASHCLGNHSEFRGYYRPNQITQPEVKPESMVHEARSMQQLVHRLAPFAVGTGGIAVIASGLYIAYLIIGVGTIRHHAETAHVSYINCWGLIPVWRSEYSQLHHSKVSPAEMDDCSVCLCSKSNVCFTNCGHSCVCLTCASILTTCPVCSAKIEGVKITNMPSVEDSLLL